MTDEKTAELAVYERWFRETGNVLYAWQAAARCLSLSPAEPLPEWVAAVIRDAAVALTRLATLRDPCTGERSVPPTRALARALALVPQALKLSAKGKKSAFARQLADHYDQCAALDVDRGWAPETYAVTRTLGAAQRHIRRGRKLTGLQNLRR